MKTQSQSVKKDGWRKIMDSELGVLAVLILLFLFFSFSTSSFLTADNLFNVLRQISVSGILAIGMTFVIISGGIDLSVGSILGFCGVVTASIANASNGSWFLGILAGLACGVLLGLINGIIISKFNVVPFIQTLAMMIVARGMTMMYSDGKPISDLHPSIKVIGKDSVLFIPISVWILLITAFGAFFILKYTKFGRHIYAFGGNEKAARISGINVTRLRTIVYCISGVLCGLAAIVLTSRVASGLPRAGEGYEMTAIAAVVIGGTSLTGGKGKIGGTIIGMLIMGVLNNGLDLMNVSTYNQQIITGCIITLAVLMDSIKNKNKK